MKLLFCQDCWDIFKLSLNEVRQCECGKVKGRYVDNLMAENNGAGISIAIGNGSLVQAIYDMKRHQAETGYQADRQSYYEENNGKIEYAWVRPNFGKGNPHSRLMREE